MKKSKLCALSFLILLGSCSSSSSNSNVPTSSVTNNEVVSTSTISPTTGTSEIITTSTPSTTISTTVSPTTTVEPTTEEVINPISLSEVYAEIAKVEINDKGTGIGNKVAFEAYYIAKLNNNVLIFTDGSLYISLAGDNKISNGFALNAKYLITGYAARYLYKGDVELIDKQVIPGTNFSMSFDNSELITANELLAKSKDDLNIYKKLFRFKGYVGLNTTNQTKDKFTLRDNKDTYKNVTLTSNCSKVVHVTNYDDLSIYNAFVDYYNDDLIVDLNFIVDSYNTEVKAFKVYVFATSIK